MAPVPLPRRLADPLAGALYLALGLLVMAHYLPHPTEVVDRMLPEDNTWVTFVLQHGAYSVRHLTDPLHSDRVHVPYGVNMMANNSVLGVTIPLAPLTLLAGAKVSYVVWTVLAFAATAATSYWACCHSSSWGC